MVHHCCSRLIALVAVVSLSLVVAVGCGEDEVDGNDNEVTENNETTNPGENQNGAGVCEEIDCGDDETCYRGECLADCDGADDCEAGQRCFDQGGHCVSLDCAGYDCEGGEFCYHGVCAANCNVDDDCQGDDAVCEEGHCIDLCFERDGQEICPELAVSTADPSDVTAQSATIGGQLEEVPPTLPTNHGLCWSTDPEPSVGEDDCQSEGLATGPRSFEHQLDDLSEGTEYFVRAYATVRGDDEYGDQVSFEASDDEDPGDEIYSLSTGSRDDTACRLDEDGTEAEWCFDDHDGDVDRVAVDPEGNLYTASGDETACRVEEGEERWCDDHGLRVYDIAVDDDYVYTVAGDAADDDWIGCKFGREDGDEQWCLDRDESHDGLIRAVAVDDDYIYSADNEGTVCYGGDDGDIEDCFDAHDDAIHSLAVDGQFIYTASWDETVCKFDDNMLEWCYEGHDDEVRGVAVDADGYVYTASVDETVCKIDEDNNEEWCNDDHDIWVESVAVDPAGYVYTGPQEARTCKLDGDDGSQVWCNDDHEDQVRGVAVEPGLYGAFPGAW